MTYHPLHDGWTVAPANSADPSQVAPVASAGPVPAAVPGCVHTDLLAAGLIPDPYLDDNEVRLSWIGRTDWVYETTFPWSEADESRVDLVCEGLDTVATVTLNGTDIGSTANMHRSYRFDAGPLLRSGENRLRIKLDSAYGYAEAQQARLGDRPNAYPEPFNFIRKMACNFGWDWGPKLVTAGIWQPIGLHTWSVARLASVRPLVTVADDGTGRVELHVEVERDTAEPLSVSAEICGVRGQATIEPGGRTASLLLEVPEPALWWPRGHGDQHLHPLEVTLRSTKTGQSLDTGQALGTDHSIDTGQALGTDQAPGAGRVLDRWQRRVGFRSLRIDTTEDEHGTPFTFVINDVPVFIRGVNWIPDDVFANRISRQRLAERFTQAIDANVNLLRVWGGGRYESEDFYELADEMGLLVQQDFLFACAAYPEEEPFASEVAAEARQHVTRLASHPSLVLWTGNNENIWGWHDWNWQQELAGRSWGAGYYFGSLPGIMAELDPTRPYWPGSPWSGRQGLHPNDPAHGTMHIWDVWNERDYLHYRDYKSRFVAEFGFQGPPTFATLRRALSDDPLAHDSPGMAHHQKADDGDGKLRRGLEAHLPEPRDFADWHYLTQVNQARAVAVGVEHLRSLSPLCSGAILWQLNDCWPVTSWAVIDGDGRRKPLWYALRRSYAERLLTIQPRPEGPAVIGVNHGRGTWRTEVEVTRRTLSGEPRAKSAYALEVPAGATITLPLPPDVATPDDAAGEVLVADADGDRAWWFFAEDREIAYPSPRYDAEVEPAADGYRVTVTARTVLRDLTLFADRLDPAALVDTALVTLLPGESTTFAVRTSAELPAEQLTSKPVLRCVNDVQ